MKPIADFAYAVSRVHSIENKMIGMDGLGRICESESLDDAYKILSDYGYSIDIVHAASHNDILKNEMDKTLELVKKNVPDHTYINIFLLNSDFHNLKVLLKSEKLEADYSDILLDNGVYTKESMIEYVRERYYSKLTDNMRSAIEEVLDTMGKINDPQMIDIIFDRAYFQDCLEIAVTLRSSFLNEYVKMIIDLTNIKSFIRVRKLELDLELLLKVLIGGGTIDCKFYSDHFDSQNEKIISGFKLTKYHDLILAGIDGTAEYTSLSLFEKAVDEYIINSIRPYRYGVFGIEPVLAHIIAKEYEILNVRIALSGVINNIRPEKLKERLRITYA